MDRGGKRNSSKRNKQAKAHSSTRLPPHATVFFDPRPCSAPPPSAPIRLSTFAINVPSRAFFSATDRVVPPAPSAPVAGTLFDGESSNGFVEDRDFRCFVGVEGLRFGEWWFWEGEAESVGERGIGKRGDGWDAEEEGRRGVREVVDEDVGE